MIARHLCVHVRLGVKLGRKLGCAGGSGARRLNFHQCARRNDISNRRHPPTQYQIHRPAATTLFGRWRKHAFCLLRRRDGTHYLFIILAL